MKTVNCEEVKQVNCEKVKRVNYEEVNCEKVKTVNDEEVKQVNCDHNLKEQRWWSDTLKPLGLWLSDHYDWVTTLIKWPVQPNGTSVTTTASLVKAPSEAQLVTAGLNMTAGWVLFWRNKFD